MERNKRMKRKRRVKIYGTKDCPRLVASRSNKNIYAQLIDDQGKKTLIGIISAKLSSEKKKKKTDLAFLLGQTVARLALKKGIKKVVFDRSGYKYHGRIKAVAEGARKGGLQF